MSYVEEDGVGYMVCDNCGKDIKDAVTPAECSEEDICGSCKKIIEYFGRSYEE